VDIMVNLLEEAKTNPDLLHGAPYTLPVRRLDDVKAAKDLDLVWKHAK
jgi:glycine dehydrogenase subunit 2